MNIELLPYGQWRCADGREVLFDRRYRPLWQRAAPNAPALPADPHERVPFIEQTWLYSEVDPPHWNADTHRLCLAKLAEWGVHT